MCSPACGGPDRIETLGEGLRAALEEIARISPGWIVPLLRPGWDERYGRKVETARLLGRKNASAAKLTAQIGADGQRLLDALDADPAAAWMNHLPQVKILRALWNQHYQRTPTGHLRYKDAGELPPAAQRIHSPYDADARYSTKGKPEADDAAWPQVSTCWTPATPAPPTSPPPRRAGSPWSPRSPCSPAATPVRAPSGPALSPSTGGPAPPAAPPARPAAPCARTNAAWSPSPSPATTAGPARSATSAPWRLPTSPAGSPSTPSRSTRPA